MKRIYNLIILLVVLISGIAWYLYDSKTDLVTNGDPDFTYEIPELIKKANEAAQNTFNETHVGKKVQLKGTVKSIDKEAPGTPVFLETNDESIIVMASFDESVKHQMESINSGTNIDILCICNGVAKPEDPDDLLSETSFTFNRCNLIENK